MGSIDDQALHTSNHTMDDLSAIQNLQLQEGFDDVHSSISRREQIRNSLSARGGTMLSTSHNKQPVSPLTVDSSKKENAESKLLEIIMSQTSGGDGRPPVAVGGPPLSPLTRKRSTSSRRRNVDVNAMDPRLNSGSKHRNASAPAVVELKDEGAFGDDRSVGTSSSALGSSSRHRQRRTGGRRDAGRDSRRGDIRESSHHRSRSKSRRRSQSPRRSSSVGRKPTPVSSSRRHRSDSVGPRRDKTNSSDDDMSIRSDRRRRKDPRSNGRSSSLRPNRQSRNRSDKSSVGSDSLEQLNKSLNSLGVASLFAEDDDETKRPISTKSLSNIDRRSQQDARGGRRQVADDDDEPKRQNSSRSLNNDRKSMHDPRGGKRSTRRSRSAERRHSDQQSSASGNDSKSMLESALDTFMVDIHGESAHTGAAESVNTGGSSQRSLSYVSASGGSPTNKGKKTKLEKIHELQAKCDRYKREWSEASKDKRYFRKELDASKFQVVSLTKKVETHVSETNILQKNLSEALQQLETTQEEQRKERSELSTTAKELAQARIDHAKSVNDCRELQANMERMEGEVKEKDRQIQSLREELDAAKANVENLEADLLYADEQITKLEDEIKRIEEEVAMYRDVANKENGEHDGEKLREAREEMEQRMFAEKEKRLEEKQRKLEEKMKLFEEEKEKYQEQQAKKEQEYQEQLAEEGEKLKSRDEDRQKLDDEIHERLKTLGDNNAALQGRLKSEQLEAASKIKKKDEVIEQLQKEIAQMKEDAKTTGVDALQEEINVIKTNADTTHAELEDALKQNKMLQEEVSELKTVNGEMKTWVVTLEDVTIDQKKIIDYEKGRMEEWRKKAGDWSSQTHQWKEKAEMWEKKAKSLDPNATPDEVPSDLGEGDPQALFLAAAVEKKKATDGGKGSSAWKFGGIFQKSSAEAPEDAQGRIEELEIENTKQSVEIKNLKSEIVQIQSAHQDKMYTMEHKCEKLRKENEALEVKSTNLSKELALARKLNQSMDIGEDP